MSEEQNKNIEIQNKNEPQNKNIIDAREFMVCLGLKTYEAHMLGLELEQAKQQNMQLAQRIVGVPENDIPQDTAFRENETAKKETVRKGSVRFPAKDGKASFGPDVHGGGAVQGAGAAGVAAWHAKQIKEMREAMERGKGKTISPKSE